MKRITLFVGTLALCVAPAFAQNALSFTTLSGSVLASTTNICVASATNIVVPSLASGVLGSFLVVDSEVMRVQAAGLSSLCFNVYRGLVANEFTGQATNHGNGAKVWILGQNINTGDPSRPISTTSFFSQRAFQPFVVAATPTLFGVGATSVTDVNGTFFISALELDQNGLFTGACWLNGATVTTDKHIAYLWDATGTLIANTTLAGTADAGASQYQCVSFTAPVALLGPAQYFIGVQANGTTDNIQMYNTGAHAYPTQSFTGVFGTPKAIATIPTTFTAAVGPFMQLF